MGRFSPTVMPTPSWTNGLAQGVENIGDALMQRRQFNQQKLNQDREFALQQQSQDVRNAEAGYTPAQPYGQNTPLDRVSNAGIADAGTPASFDPTKSLTYALMSGRAGYANQRNQDTIEGRHQDVIQRGINTDKAIGLKYGTVGDNGFTPGAMPQASIFQHAPQMEQQNGQFQDREAIRAAQLGEAIRHNHAMEARPVGGSRMPIGGGAVPTGPEKTAINNMTKTYEQPQKVPGRLNADGSSLMTRYTPGLDPNAASAKAVHNVNMTRMALGQDTLSNPGSLKATAPASTSGVEKDGTAASTTTPTAQGIAQPKHLGSGHANQSTTTVSTTLPVSPTAPSASTPLKPLGAKDKAQAQTDPKAEAFYKSLGYKRGVDY